MKAFIDKMSQLGFKLEQGGPLKIKTSAVGTAPPRTRLTLNRPCIMLTFQKTRPGEADTNAVKTAYEKMLERTGRKENECTFPLQALRRGQKLTKRKLTLVLGPPSATN